MSSHRIVSSTGCSGEQPKACSPRLSSHSTQFLQHYLPDPFAIIGLSDALTAIEAARVHGNPRLILLGVILRMMDRRTNLAKTLCDYVQAKFALDGHESLKFATTIDRSTEVPKAQREGTTLFATAPVLRSPTSGASPGISSRRPPCSAIARPRSRHPSRPRLLPSHTPFP
jgi:hypothetical protein